MVSFISLFMILNHLFVILVKSSKISKIKSQLTVCQDYSVLLRNENNFATIVDVINGSTVNLLCRFCESKNVYKKQTWYFKKRGLDVIKSKIISETGNLFIMNSKELQLKNFNISLSGIYICEYSDDYIEGTFTYVLDEIFDVKPKVGLPDEWQRYKRQNFDQINKNFRLSKFEPFMSINNKVKLSFEILSFLEDWGPCEPIGKRKGLRRRLAKCRLTHLPNKRYSNTSDSISRLLDKYDISCRSKTLNKMLPVLSAIVNIPDFEIIEACNLRNDPKRHGEKKTYYKYKDLKQIGENGHLNLICPEIEGWSQIDWFKNNIFLNSSFRNNIADSDEEPHLTIDSYGTLYILHATKNEEAIYSCTVNGEPMLMCDVRVVSKSRLLNEEFIRYSIYLGFVLSLTLTCYCAGIFVAWHRRTSFADPFHLNNQNVKRKIKNKISN